MYYLYILHLSNNKLYTGITGDLKRRFREHISGRVESTKHKLPLKLVYYEGYVLKSDVMRREDFLKSTEGKKLLRKQIRDLLLKLNYL